MRSAMVVMGLALVLGAGHSQEKSAKRPTVDVGAGRVAWFDITTGDLVKSREFYGELFDWEFSSLAETDLAVEIMAGGEAIGTLRVAEGKLSPFDGVIYVQVDDLEESCRTATELGGTIVPGFPFNLTDRAGAIALLLDPAGHPIGMYCPNPLSAPESK